MNFLAKRIPAGFLATVQAVGLLAACAKGASTQDLPVFRQAAEGLYRGGQPTNQGFVLLKLQGIKTVVNLRANNDEEQVVRSLGMQYVHIPLSAWRPVPPESLETYFAVLRDRRNYPVLVHCERGLDRTGAMIGFYRMAFQDWSADRAIEEARGLGMRWWYWRLRNQLREFERNPNGRKGATRGDGK